MNIINLNAFNNEFFSKIIELNKNFCLLKSMIEEENKFDPKYKTELCKKFQSTGKCPYGYKCRFAHGKEELLSKSQGLNYKKKPCKTFNERGYCPYGSRCSFRHDERNFSETSFSYFYLQLFLFKMYNFYPLKKTFYSEKSPLLNGRLPIFEEISQNFLNKNNRNESTNDNNEITNINNSFSTISNTSNEENEQKKFSNNDLYLAELNPNEIKENNINNEKVLFCKMKVKDCPNQINKENISASINQKS
jgi:hypothetical protein